METNEQTPANAVAPEEVVKFLDRYDWLMAGGLVVCVGLLAFAGSFPFPHPAQWRELAAAALLSPAKSIMDGPWLYLVNWLFGFAGLARGISLLGIAGCVAQGLVCGGLYMALRALWLEWLDPDVAEEPVGFIETRSGSMLGVLIFSFAATTWRTAQFMSADFMLISLATLAMVVWAFSRRSGNLGFVLIAYVIGGALTAMTPLGLVMTVLMFVCDERSRFMKQFALGSEDEAEEAGAVELRKCIVSIIAFIVGFLIIFPLCLLASMKFGLVAENESGIGRLIVLWCATWCGLAKGSIRSVGTISIVLYPILVVMVITAGRRLRTIPEGGGKALRYIFLLALAGVAAATLARRFSGNSRLILDVVRDYAVAVSDSCEGVNWLFTDGEFDDAIRLTMATRGRPTAVMSVMSVPNKMEATIFRRYAPEMMDRAMFAAGGSEVFKSWAQERRDRLTQSAWMLGSGTVRKYDAKAPIRSYGGVIRLETESMKEAWPKVVKAIRDIQNKAIAVVGRGSFLSYTDDTLSSLLDSLLWRLARLADERATGRASVGDAAGVRREREQVHMLDSLNISLRNCGEKIERLLPTENVVLTPREGLDVAIKRADFALAQRYAVAVLAANPDDSTAHFAMGMSALELKDYFTTAKHLELCLKARPNEPAALNNLAIAYLKLNRLDRALECAEKAAKVHPKSEEIKRNLNEIRIKIGNRQQDQDQS